MIFAKANIFYKVNVKYFCKSTSGRIGNMNRKICALLSAGIIIMALCPFALSEDTGFMILSKNKQLADSYFEGGRLKAQYIEQMNAQIGKAPPQLTSLFGNNKINIYLTLDDGADSIYYVNTQGGKVIKVLQGAKSDADLEIKAAEKTIDRIALSKDPVGEFLKAMGSGEIKYTGLTPEGETKGLIVNVMTGVASFFKGILDFLSSLFK